MTGLSDEPHSGLYRWQGVNPVVEVRSGMRTHRRIMLILHDEEPGLLLYQFITLEDEIAEEFERVALSEMGSDTMVRWMQDYFG